ncbi:hypothetical protein [Veillonella intestinalis]|uniref:hypothetical protein n=1 Tax=Veillonella intestinalis TaxID=2941341 RepID=UPI00203D6118|nr:hypothetical protein [Veillonella intestinalis]
MNISIILKYIGIITVSLLCIIIFLFLIIKIRRFFFELGKPWREINRKGMLLHARLSGLELKRAQDNNEEYDRNNTYLLLYEACGGDNPEIIINCIIDDDYLINGLINILTHSTVFSSLQWNQQENILNFIENEIQMSPQIVLVIRVKEFFGNESAANYILDIITGRLI